MPESLSDIRVANALEQIVPILQAIKIILEKIEQKTPTLAEFRHILIYSSFISSKGKEFTIKDKNKMKAMMQEWADIFQEI